jgi:hypothetical protein
VKASLHVLAPRILTDAVKEGGRARSDQQQRIRPTRRDRAAARRRHRPRTLAAASVERGVTNAAKQEKKLLR